MSFICRNKISQSGITLIEILASLSILMMAAMALSAVIYQGQLQSSKNSMLSGADIFRRKLSAVLSSDIAWANTVGADNQLNRCLGGSNCPGGFINRNNPRPFDVYDASGALVYRGTSGSEGVTPSGTRCDTFNANTTNPICPMRFEVSWFALTGGIRPQVGIVASLVLSKDSPIKINTNNYSIGACSLSTTNGSGQVRCLQYENFFLR